MSTVIPSANIQVPPPPKLGVGLLYQEELHPIIERRRSCIDFLEVIPDLFWTDTGPGQTHRYLENRQATDVLRRLQKEMPIVLHSIGLSIGTRIDLIALTCRKLLVGRVLKFPWHSDHLAFMLAEPASGRLTRCDHAPAVRPRVARFVDSALAEVRSQIPVRFLLENNVYFFKYADQEYDEAIF